MKSDDNVELHKFVTAKDQLFLFATTIQQLKFLCFPLGYFTKEETRDLACELKISISAKPESQDIRFVKIKSYEDIINKLRPQSCRKAKLFTLKEEL